MEISSKTPSPKMDDSENVDGANKPWRCRGAAAKVAPHDAGKLKEEDVDQGIFGASGVGQAGQFGRFGGLGAAPGHVGHAVGVAGGVGGVGALANEGDWKAMGKLTFKKSDLGISKGATSFFLQDLSQVVSERGDSTYATWYDEKGKAKKEYSFEELWKEAGLIAYHLRLKWNLNKGDRVVLCYNFGLHFFASLLGCLRAGVVAVLVYPPGPPLAKSLQKMAAVVSDCSPMLILTDSDVNKLRQADHVNLLSKSRLMWPNIQWKTTDKLMKSCIRQSKSFFPNKVVPRGADEVQVFDDPSTKPSDLAFLQYTSGSTGNPLGVMVTFEALKANVALVKNGFLKSFGDDGGLPPEMIGFSWLPQYHDLGLIYAGITPFASGWRMHMMSPISFIKNPLLWLELMSKHGVSWSITPDFGIQYLSRKFHEAQEKDGGDCPIAELDLTSLRHIGVSAEPVRLTTPSALDMLHEHGLRRDWFYTGYGLAENVVGVCWTHNATTPQDPSKGSFIACGHRKNFDESLSVKIVSEATQEELPDGETGEIWLGGPSKAAGYFGKPDLTKEVFQAKLRGAVTACNMVTGTFLRTGDLGFFENDYLYICGRIKDVIIFNGANHFPQDVELTAQESSSAVRPGCIAAFSHDESQQDGNVELVFEIRKEMIRDVDKICHDIRVGVASSTGLVLTRVVAIREKTIPKTTSGKIRRRATRDALHAGHLNVILDSSQSNMNGLVPHKQEQSIANTAHLDSAPVAGSKVPGVDSDVVVVGAGMVGLCFARDMASLGHQVTVVEKSSAIGGTWAKNDYPGLRLHQPGCSYRCISLAPAWTKSHEKEEYYRPTRKEIFDYCHQLAQHENITLLLESNCPYEERMMEGDDTVVVDVNGIKHKTRYLFASTGLSASTNGLPVVPAPFHLRKNQGHGPLVIHSSQINGEVVEQFKRVQGRKVILGSGKAAVDILQIFEPSDNILWAHRGHTYFLDREIIERNFEDDGVAFSQRLNLMTAASSIPEWISYAKSANLFISCNGPISNRKVAFGGGICSREELRHADSFKQFLLQSVEESSGHTILLKAKDTNVHLSNGDCVVLCTGQRNDYLKRPDLTNSFAQSGPFTMNSAPLNAIMPLCVASDALCGKPLSIVEEQRMKQKIDLLTFEHDDPREHDIRTCASLSLITKFTLLRGVKGDIAYMSQWQNDWYGLDMAVEDVLAVMRGEHESLVRETPNGRMATKTQLVGTQPIFIAPSTEEEIRIVEAWQSVLGVDQVGINDSFFDLGGHSLLAIKLASELGCDVTDIMSNPTPSSLLHLLKNAHSSTQQSMLESLEASHTMTQSEQRIHFIHLQDPASRSYHMPICVQFEAAIEIKTNLELAIASLPVLRTRFVDGKAIEDATVPVVDLADANEDEKSELLFAPFNAEAGPLCRFGVEEGQNVLLGCIHHSIADGRSIEILLEAIASGQVNYFTKENTIRKYAAYEARQEVKDKHKASVEAMMTILGDTPPRLEVDFASPSSFDSSIATLDKSTVDAMRASCLKEGISMFSMALGILHKCMRAYSQEAYTIGTAYDARPSHFRDSVGMYVNTVLIPFLGGVKGDTETLKDLHSRWTHGILPHASAPYDMVSSLGYGCNVYLAFNVGVAECKNNCSKVQYEMQSVNISQDNIEAPFDLAVTWSESNEGDGSLVVLFESGVGPWPGLKDRFFLALGKYLTGDYGEDNTKPTSSLLPREEAQVMEWGKGPQRPVRNCCLHELFEKQAYLSPERVALLDDRCTKSMTYGELERKSSDLASALQMQGARPNTFIGILMEERKFDMYVAVLGILKSGAAYVPMHARLFSKERTKFIVNDTGMQLLVTTEDNAELAEKVRDECICCHQVINVTEFTVNEPPTRAMNTQLMQPCAAKPTDCAYMIYTSGTTGKPKGVVCNHLGPVNMIDFDGIFGSAVAGQDVMGCSAPHIFDAFVEGCFGTLGSGLSLSLDIKGCTLLDCTPSLANILLNDGSNSGVKLLIVGGEACIQGLDENVSLFYNTYGPTECSIVATAGTRSDTIGRPLPNATCYIVHPDGTLCPPGVSGELWIGGIGVSMGYHNRPELTAEKFIPNPFTSSGKVYKTGDRVKWNDDGEIIYLGRFDDQVKVNGYRIELGEIQAELEKQANVEGALVLLHEEKLVAFVASKLGDESDNTTMKTHIMESLKSEECPLASYMIPWKIVVLDKFPLTPNGKIDARFLIKLLDRGHSCDVVPPSTVTQTYLRDLFKEMLGLEQIGIDCSFTELGGHSLVVMEAVNKIRCQFGINTFSVRQFVQLDSARSIAQHIDDVIAQEMKDDPENQDTPVPDNNSSTKKARLNHSLAKCTGAILLFASIWISILPANIMVSRSFRARIGLWTESSKSLSSSYVAYIGLLLAAMGISAACFATIGWTHCQLLRKSLGVTNRIKKGSLQYALWYAFDREWFLINLVAEKICGGTIFFPWFYQVFGAEIGKDNFFEDLRVRMPFMLNAGDHVAVETGAQLETLVEQGNGDIIVDTLTLEDNVVVGANSHIGLGAHLGMSVMVKPLSVVSRAWNIEENRIVLGHSIGANETAMVIPSVVESIAPLPYHVAHLLGRLMPHIFTGFVIIGTDVAIIDMLDCFGIYHGIIVATLVLSLPLIASFGQLMGAVCARFIRQVVTGSQREPGWSKINTKSFLKHRLASQVYQTTINSLGGSILSRVAMKLIFNVKTDIMNAFLPQIEEPDLTSIGENVFGANGVKLQNSTFYPGGLVCFDRIHIGDNTMILDRSVIGPGSKLEANVMVGSITSTTEETQHHAGNVLMGVPPLRLQTRNLAEGGNDTRLAGEPLSHSLLLYVSTIYFRLIIGFTTLIPLYSNAVIWIVFNDNSLMVRLGIALAAVPITLTCVAIAILSICLVIKKFMIGSYKKFLSLGVIGLDSWEAFKWKLSNVLIHEACWVPLLLVNEFWLTAVFWKMMGAKIGKQTKIDPDALLFEVDVFEIGDYCRVEKEATLLCHKFNNGGLEISPIMIPSHTKIGARAVILPGSDIMDEHCNILPLTSVNPGGQLMSGTWQGSPAEKADIELGSSTLCRPSSHFSGTKPLADNFWV